MAQQYWRHLVLLGLLGVLGCLCITKTRQPPRKPESVVSSSRKYVCGEPVSATSLVSVSFNWLQPAHVLAPATAGLFKHFLVGCFFHKVAIIAFH